MSTSKSVTLHKGKRIKNAQLTEYQSEIESLNKWSIPKIPNRDIYKIGLLDYRSLIAIKTHERTSTVDEEEQIIKLLSQKDIDPYMDKYKYIHIGLIQVAFKPLTLQGLNTSLLISLRDARCLNYIQSLMGVMETSLCNGPVFFNVYPNLSLSLTDPNILESVNLNIKTHGYNFLHGSETIAIIYRIHYKTLSSLAPQAKIHTKPGETVLVETNLLTSNVATNRQIRWDEVNFPESWIIPNAVHPQPPTNTDINQIVETNDGEVEIVFNPLRTVKLFDASISNSRKSVSRSESNRVSEIRGINISETNIPHPIYKEKDKFSPTSSEMSFHL